MIIEKGWIIAIDQDEILFTIYYFFSIIYSMQFYHLLKVGKGTGSSVRIVVTTQPKFVKKLPKHTGAPLQKKQVGMIVMPLIGIHI